MSVMKTRKRETESASLIRVEPVNGFPSSKTSARTTITRVSTDLNQLTTPSAQPESPTNPADKTTHPAGNLPVTSQRAGEKTCYFESDARMMYEVFTKK